MESVFRPPGESPRCGNDLTRGNNAVHPSFYRFLSLPWFLFGPNSGPFPLETGEKTGHPDPLSGPICLRVLTNSCAYDMSSLLSWIRVTELGLDSASRADAKTGRYRRRSLVLFRSRLDAIRSRPYSSGCLHQHFFLAQFHGTHLNSTSLSQNAPNSSPVLCCMCQIQTQLRPPHTALLSLH
jgi:hypothetical protein